MFQKPFSFNDYTDKFGLLSKLTFHKSYFNIENISNTDSDLKYTNETKTDQSELRNPSPVFVKHFANQGYPGKLTEKILTQFTELVKRSSNQALNDSITDRLKTALGKEEARTAIKQKVRSLKSQ